MFKKLFIYGGLLTVVAVLLFGGAAFSHVKNGVSWVRGQVQEKVPVEYELQRARQLIQDSKPEIKKCKRLIAQVGHGRERSHGIPRARHTPHIA